MATVGASIQVLYAGRLEFFSREGFDVTVVCASSPLDDAIRARGVRLLTVPFTRALSPWSDLRALVALCRLLRAERFDIVEVATPKAALLGAIAARLARCRAVVHILHGMPYEGRRGLMGALLRGATAVPCRLAHATFAVSPSVQQRVCGDGLGKATQVHVLGAGSANGVDLDAFSPRLRTLSSGVRERHGIPGDAVVIGFVGRVTRDKGVDDLVRAFSALHLRHADSVLMVVGDYEERDRPAEETMRALASHPGIRHVGWVDDVAPAMAAMDVVVLPTYREGLGNVLLEAAALGLPTVATDATGARDAIVDGVTGIQVPVGHVVALEEALARLVRDAPLRQRMGREGRAWVAGRFDRHRVWRAYADAYEALLETASRGSAGAIGRRSAAAARGSRDAATQDGTRVSAAGRSAGSPAP